MMVPQLSLLLGLSRSDDLDKKYFTIFICAVWLLTFHCGFISQLVLNSTKEIKLKAAKELGGHWRE